MRADVKPRMLNRICAHSEIIACALGACALDAALIGSLLHEAPLRTIATNWQTMLYLLIALIPATLLGCIAGAFISGPVRVFCSRINGAPLKPGDQVMILSGPHKGTVAEVYEISRGQGGWELARVHLGKEYEERFADIFEEYSLLRMRRVEQQGSN